MDTAAERFAKCQRRANRAHLDDFIATMEARNCDPKHVRTTRTYIRRIIDQAGAIRLSDLTLSAVELAVGRIQKEHGLSARAVNAHTTAAKAFVNWAKEDNRIRAKRVGEHRPPERGGRPALCPPDPHGGVADPDRLGPDRSRVEGMRGEDRSMFYLLGAMTGFRRTGIGSLRPERPGRADADRPPRCFQDEERQGCRTAHPGDGGGCAESLACRQDSWESRVRLAGEDRRDAPLGSSPLRIEPVDDQGRVVDTHSLRHGYISAVPPLPAFPSRWPRPWPATLIPS